MLLELDTKSPIPIYIQLRNQIVMGIGHGMLVSGEQLPTVRQLASDIGVNMMTVNKAYQLLKSEGFIDIDRRHGATVAPVQNQSAAYREKLTEELELLAAQACLKGMKEQEFLSICKTIFGQMHPSSLYLKEV